ncbi:MAG: ABC transporter permease, partial [Lachnospiraceae bacterium]|nr:ABC transporter permease [Lachnospiraceae bacterium]
KLLVALEMGFFVTAGTLPLIVLVVFFSKTYIFSVLLCIFYSVFSLTAESSFGVLPKALCWLMPIPLTTLWSAGDMEQHGVIEIRGRLQYLIPTTFQTIVILGAWAFLSIVVIDFLYKKRGE